MKRLLVALLALPWLALAQPAIVASKPCLMDGTGCFTTAYSNITGISASKLLGRGSASSGAAQEITLGTGLTISGTTLTPDVSGSGASGRLALWSGTGTLTSDAGLTYSGTGATHTVFATKLYGHTNAAGPTLKLDTLGFRAGGRITFNDSGTESDPTVYGTDLSLSRISAGVVGVGTGAAGSVAGTVSAAQLTLGGDAFATRRAAATLQLGAADSGTPVAQTIAFQGSRGGTDTNTAGADATIQGSLGTGTGGGGNILIRTAPRGSTGSAQNTPSDRLVLAAKQVTLTESSATPILDVAVPSGSVAGGEVLYTIRADDATDFQALTGRVQWSAVNKGGTLTASINLVGTETTAVSAGTLTNTATISTGTNLVTINLNAVSSLTQTTLYAYVQAQNNGTGNSTTK